ncbi:MAG: DUF2513 domain-containing protein [Candidatus Kapabacteria bacterium]|nr:DUF2513 domain-containing protein [Candidatus Kapabacteria bacterium]
MKRDMELIRKILLEIENEENAIVDPGALQTRIISDFDNETFESEILALFEHLFLLIQAGYLETCDLEGNPLLELQHGQQVNNYIFMHHFVRLTWQGHEFIASIKDDNVWHKIKERVGSESVNLPIGILMQLGLSVIKTAVGLPA